jgi:hypothetical protein
MGSELDVSISRDESATIEISSMEPGTVFAHVGSIYMRVANPHQLHGLFLKDIEDSVREAGTRANALIQPFQVVGFDASEFGRVVKKANMVIEL